MACDNCDCARCKLARQGTPPKPLPWQPPALPYNGFDPCAGCPGSKGGVCMNTICPKRIRVTYGNDAMP